MTSAQSEREPGAGPPGWQPAWVCCSLFGGSPTGADAPGPGVAPQVVAGHLQPWGLCSGLSATQWGQRLSLGPHELPPSPGPLELTLPLPRSYPAHRAVAARAPLRKPENKPTTETFRSHSTWSPITGGETPRAGRPAHRRPWMLGPQPLLLPAQKPNHSSAATAPAVSDAPSSSGPTTGGLGLLPPAWGMPPPSPLGFPGCSTVRTSARPQLGRPLPSPHLQTSAPAGPNPRPWRSSLLLTARPLRCCARRTAAAKAPLPASGPCSQAPPPAPILREHPQEPQSGAKRDGRAPRSELWPPRLNQDPPHSRQPRPGHTSEASSISHPAQHPPCL